MQGSIQSHRYTGECMECQTLLGRELMVSLRDSKGASSLGDSSGCVTVKALESSSSELGNALRK